MFVFLHQSDKLSSSGPRFSQTWVWGDGLGALWTVSWRVPRRLIGQAVFSSATAFICSWLGFMSQMRERSIPIELGFPICSANSGGILMDVFAGMGMGLMMLLVSAAPLRWRGIWSGGGALAVGLWIATVGVLNGVVMAAVRILAQSGLIGSALLLRVSCIALGLAVAMLFGCGRATEKVDRRGVPGMANGGKYSVLEPITDGGECLAKCAPMLALMLATGATSTIWMIAGTLLGEITETIDDVARRQLVTFGVWCVGALLLLGGPLHYLGWQFI